MFETGSLNEESFIVAFEVPTEEPRRYVPPPDGLNAPYACVAPANNPTATRNPMMYFMRILLNYNIIYEYVLDGYYLTPHLRLLLKVPTVNRGQLNTPRENTQKSPRGLHHISHDTLAIALGR